MISQFVFFCGFTHNKFSGTCSIFYRVVESVGEGVSEVKKGDVVIPVFMAQCLECIDCKSKKSNLCSKVPFRMSGNMPRHESSRFTDLKGQTIHHFLFVSSFSQYTVVDIANLTKIDDPYSSVPLDKACLLSCGISTGKFPFPFF